MTYRTYTCLTELIRVLRNLYCNSDTEVPVGTTGLITEVPVGTTEHIQRYPEVHLDLYYISFFNHIQSLII